MQWLATNPSVENYSDITWS
uniref:Uncharacterized protein n=1 Tax=Arundo donax TaxID=35708 RepID=A0A0A8ZRA7_ARUDO